MDSPKLPGDRGALTRYESRALEHAQPGQGYGYIPMAPHEPTLLDYWHILLKRKGVVAATLLIVVTAVAFYTFRMTPQYEAMGRIAIYRENPEALGVQDVTPTGSSDDWDYSVAIATQVQVLDSDALAMQVIKNMGLDKDPSFNPGARKAAAGNGLNGTATYDAADEAAMIGRFHGGLKIAPVPDTRLIELRYMGPDPRMDAQIVNTLASTYIEQNFRTKYEATMQASDWLSKQLADLQMKVEQSQEKLVEYQKENGILGIDDKQNIITSKLDDLNKELTSAQADRIEKEANYNLLKSGSPELIPGAVGQMSLISTLRSQEAELQQQYAQARVQFGPQFPKVRELQDQLAQVQANIAREEQKLATKVTNEYKAAVGREQMLHAALDQQKGEANKLNEKAIEYNILKREADTNRQLYDNLLTKLKEAGVSAGLQSSNVRIVDRARVPVAPTKPDVPRNLAIALLVGLTGGIGLAFMLEMFDNTVRTPEQVQSISALPALGMIPLGYRLPGQNKLIRRLAPRPAPKTQPVELVAYSRPKSEIAESYRALRTSILLSSLGRPPKVIMVTSALPQEGKTTTSINTAIVLAQKGARVLLVDADLRRPGIHRHLGIKTRSGLSTLLTGSDVLENVVLPSPQLPNLFVLPAGPPPPHPAELLGSALMKQFLAQWRERFDHIVIDTPPALSVTDAVLLSVDADAVMLVLRSGQTSKESLRRARDLLMQVNARVMGVVVNAVDLQSPDLNYYYYGTKYGGQYYDDSPRK